MVKHASCQNSQPLRAASLSKLDNTVNNNSIFNTKCAEFCACNHPCNLGQKSFPLLQLIFTSLFSPYLSIKSSLQSPLTLPSSIPQ